MEALRGLSPTTFNSLLVNALHLQRSMVEVALLKYRELNHGRFDAELHGATAKMWRRRPIRGASSPRTVCNRSCRRR